MPGSALIAIVDDDHSVREALTSLVRSLGYVAIAFERAEDLLRSDRRSGMSCLIADVHMPGMTGVELHDRLVTAGEPIPTILITAFPDERGRERALQAGAIGWLTKPFSEDALLACIRSTLGHHQAGRSIDQKSAGPLSGDRPPIDRPSSRDRSRPSRGRGD